MLKTRESELQFPAFFSNPPAPHQPREFLSQSHRKPGCAARKTTVAVYDCAARGTSAMCAFLNLDYFFPRHEWGGDDRYRRFRARGHCRFPLWRMAQNEVSSAPTFCAILILLSSVSVAGLYAGGETCRCYSTRISEATGSACRPQTLIPFPR